MRAVLSVDIPIDRVAVFAEMAWLERRPELGLLCRAARDHDRRIWPETIHAALPGLGDAGARNLIAWCAKLGLCDARGGLTALGEDVAEHDEAPVPEQGVYDLWLARHPIFGKRILAIARLASTRDPRFDNVTPLAVEPERGTLFRSVVNPKERFLLRDLPTNNGQIGGLPASTNATCRLSWTLDFPNKRDQWRLDGEIEAPNGRMKHLQHEPESDGIDLERLAMTWGAGPLSSFGTWRSDVGRLAVAFRGLGDSEQETFRKTLTLPQVEVPGKGTYDNATLNDVPIGPFSNLDAQEWAIARFDRHLAKNPGYRSRAEVRRVFAKLTERTPLQPFRPSLPAHDELIGDQLHARDPERFWSLAAPIDLAPDPVPPDELGALQINASPGGDR